MKKLYYIYNENFEITHAQFFTEGEQPENAIFIEVCNFSKPMVNPETFEVYEGATPEEIADANKPKVPTQARSMNLRLVLIQNGISMQSIYNLIASLPIQQNELAYQMFEYATHYDRNNQMLNTLAQMMNISQEQLDEFFIQAENLVI